MSDVLRYLEDFENAYPAAVARTAASLTFARFENGFADVEADCTIARVSRKIVG